MPKYFKKDFKIYFTIFIYWIFWKFIFISYYSSGLNESNFIDNKALFLLKFGFMSVCNANTNNLLKDKNDVVCDDIIHEKCSLVTKIELSEVRWQLSYKIISWACSASIFESKVLKTYKPCKWTQIGNYDIWSHYFKHIFFRLEIIHEYLDQMNN